MKQNLKKLQKIWYKKLKVSGFIDIEARDTIKENKSSDRDWMFTHQEKYGQYSKEWRESKQMYYDMATNFLNEHKFNSILEQVIWEYHANGLSMRDIAITINKTKVTHTNKDKICEIIKTLREIMKKKYIIGYRG